MSFVQVVDDFQWNEKLERWILTCKITIPSKNTDLVKNETKWYVLLEPEYPRGVIKFCPAIEDGLNGTFQHQNYNGRYSKLSDVTDWTTGSPCLITTRSQLNRLISDFEPYHAAQRLKWHFRRAYHWLLLVSENSLVKAGDPFELPEFPNSTNFPERLIFNETNATLQVWNKNNFVSGLFTFNYLVTDIKDQKKTNPIVIQAFEHKKETILSYDWGDALACDQEETKNSIERGIWFLLPDPPVTENWQAADNWQDLVNIFSQSGRSFYEELSEYVKLLRNGKPLTIIIGFPIPNKIGEDEQRIHWQGIRVEPLSRGTKYAAGYRADEKGYWIRDCSELFALSKPLKWIRSQNWAEDQIRNRGRADTWITSKKIVILGCGAIGSAIAELLVRAGLQSVIVIDPDKSDIGNMSRHTLLTSDIGLHKVLQLQKRLQLISPNVSVYPIQDWFPCTKDVDIDNIKQSDLIIDCTGSDEVAIDLSAFKWGKEKIFFSVSIGAWAKKLYLFHSKSAVFPAEQMLEEVKKLIEKDVLTDAEFPREHTGCWHAVFPARADEIWSAAVAAVQTLFQLKDINVSAGLIVLEKLTKFGESGYKIASENAANENI